MYHEGEGVAQDYAEALSWFRKSAEQGDARGQCSLGNSYAEGMGTQQDYAEAARWYRKAAEQGYAKGEFSLALMYYQGKGVPQDYAEAVRWYRKAAEQGDSAAQNYLGFSYLKGHGVRQDNAEAARWYRKAADQGDADARHVLASLQTESHVGMYIRYLGVLIAFLGGLWLSVDSALLMRSNRSWRPRAKILFGVCSMLWAGLTLYGLTHVEVRYLEDAGTFYLTKRVIAGVAIAIVIGLGLTAKRAA
jgi:hypothetical protein